MRWILGLAVLSACSREPRASRVSGTPDAGRRDVGGLRGDAAAAAPGPRPALPEAERAALTGTIYASAGEEHAFRVITIEPAGDGTGVTVTPAGGSWFPTPSATPLALISTDDGVAHTEQLALLGATPAAARTVGPAGKFVRYPSVTRDGRAVVFEADTASFRDLYRLDLDGGAITRLTDEASGCFEPSLAPDDRRVAFTSSKDGNAELYVLDGKTIKRLTTEPKDDWQPLWSPDGAWIAFLSVREAVTPRLFVIAPDGTGTRAVHHTAPVGEEQTATWSPDGTRLAYAVSTRSGASEIWVAEVASGEARRISVEGARDEAPSWSPDGRHLVYVSTRDRRIDLWLARADGSAESRLTDTPEEEWIPRWLPF